jgi:hypothetical protein
MCSSLVKPDNEDECRADFEPRSERTNRPRAGGLPSGRGCRVRMAVRAAVRAAREQPGRKEGLDVAAGRRLPSGTLESQHYYSTSTRPDLTTSIPLPSPGDLLELLRSVDTLLWLLLALHPGRFP